MHAHGFSYNMSHIDFVARGTLQEDQEKSANLKSLQRNSAQEQKNLLGDLYAMKRRPSLPESDEQVTYYAVSHDFFKLWQRFIK